MKPSSFFLVTGLLIGYSVHRKSESPSCSSPDNGQITENTNQDVPPIYDVSGASMDWSDLVKLLNDKLSSKAIEDKLRYL